MGGEEENFIREAFETNWIAPFGPNVKSFEEDIENYLGSDACAAALSSITLEELLEKGLCLPSGSNLSEADLDKIVSLILKDLSYV